MANKQDHIQDVVRFTDLTKNQQNSVYKYYPVVTKLFGLEPASDIETLKTADHKFRVEIIKFLYTADTIFGDNPPKSTTIQDALPEKIIMEGCLTKGRLSYRKQFRGYSYLTVQVLKNAHIQARDELIKNVEQDALKVKLSTEEIDIMKIKVLLDFDVERHWIEEVNNLKKNAILSEIKTDLLEHLDTLIHEALPLLVDENQTEFYDKATFRRNVTEVRTTVLKNFKEQIPLKEDEQSEEEICAEFKSEVDKVFKNLDFKNQRNEYNAKRLVTVETDKSIAKYASAIYSVLEKEPMANPNNIRVQHETLQNLHIPVANFPVVDDLRSRSKQHYVQETDRIFQEGIRKYSEISNAILKGFFRDLCTAADRFVGEEVTQICQRHKVPIGYIEQIRKRLNDQLEKVVGEIKESTISNPDIAEDLARWCVQNASKKMSGTTNSQKDTETILDVEPLLNINIRLLSGKTYEFKVYKLWTVKMLRQKLLKHLGSECGSVSLYHKAKKLRDENTLESYNIQDGDFINANISSNSTGHRTSQPQ